ncbi:unnamed protein product, partial [Didymodactylos carnosus]
MDSLQRRHLIHVFLFLTFVFIFEILACRVNFSSGSTFETETDDEIKAIEVYGLPLTIILYFLRLLALLPLPVIICHTFGLLVFNVFKEKPELLYSQLVSPGICIRVVTRGDFPELVRQNVARNIQTCDRVGLLKFMLEVVTDKPMQLDTDPRVHQTVVPEKYTTSTGAMYKSRALQYALETTLLNSSDWIVHLDEETLLTDNCLYGILNFVNDGQYQIGQGLITYGNENIVNLVTTLADSIRVGTDLGLLRFCLKVLHAPLFLFKGSFVVCQAGCEKHVTFDFGLRGSIAEDMYFAMEAMSKGYRFGWIEGEMWEKSPFTFWDFIQQRRRWIQGIILIVHDKKLPFSVRFCLGIGLYAWLTVPLTTSNIFLTPLCP